MREVRFRARPPQRSGLFIPGASAARPTSVRSRAPAVRPAARKADKRRPRPAPGDRRSCSGLPAGWRSGVAVNLLADFEGVSGAVGFFHFRCLDHPAIAHKRRRDAPRRGRWCRSGSLYRKKYRTIILPFAILLRHASRLESTTTNQLSPGRRRGVAFSTKQSLGSI